MDVLTKLVEPSETAASADEKFERHAGLEVEPVHRHLLAGRMNREKPVQWQEGFLSDELLSRGVRERWGRAVATGRESFLNPNGHRRQIGVDDEMDDFVLERA